MPDLPKLAKSVRKARDIDADLLGQIFERVPDRAAAILQFIRATGCRPSEATRLEWANVHLDAGVCILPEHKTAGKSDRPRTVYLTDGTEAVLKARRPTIGPVFTNRNGQPYKPSGIRSIFRRAAERAAKEIEAQAKRERSDELRELASRLRQLGAVGPYRLRHSFAQGASDGGNVDRDELAVLLGQSDDRSARFYFEVRNQRAKRAARTIKMPVAASA